MDAPLVGENGLPFLDGVAQDVVRSEMPKPYLEVSR